jgi:hypothetical protein
MRMTIDRFLSLVTFVVTAAFIAVMLAYIAHYDLGLSNQVVRTVAVVVAAVAAALVAIEFFGKKFRKHN